MRAAVVETREEVARSHAVLEQHILREIRFQVGRRRLQPQLREEVSVETGTIERRVAVVGSGVGHDVVDECDCEGEVGVKGRVVRFEDDEAVLARKEGNAGSEVLAVVERAVDEERVGALHEGQVVSVIGYHIEVLAVETQVVEVIPLTKSKTIARSLRRDRLLDLGTTRCQEGGRFLQEHVARSQIGHLGSVCNLLILS